MTLAAPRTAREGICRLCSRHAHACQSATIELPPSGTPRLPSPFAGTTKGRAGRRSFASLESHHQDSSLAVGLGLDRCVIER